MWYWWVCFLMCVALVLKCAFRDVFFVIRLVFLHVRRFFIQVNWVFFQVLRCSFVYPPAACAKYPPAACARCPVCGVPPFGVR